MSSLIMENSNAYLEFGSGTEIKNTEIIQHKLLSKECPSYSLHVNGDANVEYNILSDPKLYILIFRCRYYLHSMFFL